MKKSPNPLYYEEIGEDFDNYMSAYDVGRRVKLIQSLLPVDSGQRSCLEVGCGTGKISESIHKQVAKLTVSDISERLARSVGERLEVSWIEADACHLIVADATYDLVVSSECIEHTPDPEKAVAEMLRVLKPGGWLILTTPNKLWYPVLLLALLLRLRKFQGTENWTYPWVIRKQVEQSGASVRTTTGCHLFPWQIPLAKRILPYFDRRAKVLYPMMINYALQVQK